MRFSDYSKTFKKIFFSFCFLKYIIKQQGVTIMNKIKKAKKAGTLPALRNFRHS